MNALTWLLWGPLSALYARWGFAILALDLLVAGVLLVGLCRAGARDA